MQSLTTYIKNPELMDSQVVEELWELVDRHPTYQAAWLLLVRGLFQQQDRRFGAVLRKAALIVPDRSKLFELIEGDKFRIQTEHRAPQSSLHDEPATDRTQSLIDSFLSGLPEEPRPRRQHPTDASVDYMTYLLQMEDAPADEDVPAGENLSAGENLPADEDIPDEEDALVVEFPKVDFFSEADVQETVQEEDDSEILTDKAPVALGEDSDEWPEEEDVDDKYFDPLVKRMKAVMVEKAELIHCDETPFIVEQDHKCYEARQVCHDHSEGGNDKIRTVAHFTLNVLYKDLSVDRGIEQKASFLFYNLFFIHEYQPPFTVTLFIAWFQKRLPSRVSTMHQASCKPSIVRSPSGVSVPFFFRSMVNGMSYTALKGR